MTVPNTRENHADDGDLEIDAGTPDDTREDVASEVVGSERVRPRRWLQPDIGVLQYWVEGSDDRSAQREKREQREEAEAGGEGRSSAENTMPRNAAGGRAERAHQSLTRGSTATVRMSAAKFTNTVATAKTIATPCTTM